MPKLQRRESPYGWHMRSDEYATWTHNDLIDALRSSSVVSELLRRGFTLDVENEGS